MAPKRWRPVAALSHGKAGDYGYNSSREGQGMALEDNSKGNLPSGVALLIYFVWKIRPGVRRGVDSWSMPSGLAGWFRT